MIMIKRSSWYIDMAQNVLLLLQNVLICCLFELCKLIKILYDNYAYICNTLIGFLGCLLTDTGLLVVCIHQNLCIVFTI